MNSQLFERLPLSNGIIASKYQLYFPNEEKLKKGIEQIYGDFQ
jgi:hypothetical protein